MISFLREELVAIGQDFLRNIVSDVRSIELRDASELEGLPEDYIQKRLPAAGGPIQITTDYPDYNPFMSYARSASRRGDELRRRGACSGRLERHVVRRESVAIGGKLIFELGKEYGA